MQLDTWLKDWLDLRRADLAARTIESYEDLIDHYVTPLLVIPVEEITPQHIRSALAQISREGKTRTSEMLFVMLSAALRELDPNPMLKVKRPAHRAARVEPWNDAQMAVYWRGLDGHRHGLALSLGLLCGLRRGEICGLRWRDVDFDAEVLHICNQRMRLATGIHIDAPPKSAASDRYIPIPSPILPALRAARGLPDAYVDSITPSGLDQAHRQLVLRLGLPPIPLHGLRHSFATAVLRHGGEMRSLQALMGHSSYTVTANVYSHPDQEMLRRAVDCLVSSCYTVLRSNTALRRPDF